MSPSWFRYAAPGRSYALAGRIAPWASAAAAVLFAGGSYLALFVAPADFQQGDAYRVLFLHAPAAWMSMLLYVLMAAYAMLGWVFSLRVSAMMAASLATTGTIFTLLALATGALWGRPAWGTWWVWDARTTSTVILLFLYAGVLALRSAVDDRRRADRAAAVLAVVGVVNVPIIYFSVQWWSTLHQGASIRLGASPSIAGSMLWPFAVLTAACWLYAIGIALYRLRCELLEREPLAALTDHGLERK